MAREKDALAFVKKKNVLLGTFLTAHLNDFHQTMRFRDQLKAAVDDTKFDVLLLDGSGLLYIISEVFGVLVDTHRTLKSQGRSLAFCSLEPEILELIRVNRLHEYLCIYASAAEALAAESAPKSAK